MSEEKRPFFVYGTLLPGQPNHYLLEHAITHQQPAQIRDCQLFDMGAYPMLIAKPKAATHGVLMKIDAEAYEQVLVMVDALEGFNPDAPAASAYRRVEREVWLEDGRSQLAWVYLGSLQFTQGCTPIPSGDWLTHIDSKLMEISEWWQTKETVAGLHERPTSSQG